MVKGDKDFGKALKEPLYTQIREALHSDNIIKEVLEPEAVKSDIYVLPAERTIETMQAEGGNMNDKLLPNGHATDFEPEAAVIINKKAPGEIEEIEEEEIQTGSLEQDSKESYKSSTNQIVEKFCDNNKKKVVISSEVDQALGILEKVISVFRAYGFHPETRSLPGFTDGKFLNLEEDAKELKSAEDNQICSNGGDCVERNSHEARNSSCSHGSRYMFTYVQLNHSLPTPLPAELKGERKDEIYWFCIFPSFPKTRHYLHSITTFLFLQVKEIYFLMHDECISEKWIF